MKKLLSLLLAATFAISAFSAIAPAVSAESALPEVRPESETAIRDGYLLGLPSGASAAWIEAAFTSGVHVIDFTGADRTGSDMPATGWRVAAAADSAPFAKTALE